VDAGIDEAAAIEPGRTSALAALSYRDFRLFWFGLVVSNCGTWMQMFGLGWLVVQLAERDGVPQLAPLYLGLAGLSRALPGLGFGLFGGVLADRVDRRRLLIVTQTVACLIAFVLAGLTLGGHITIAEVMLIGALNSVTFAFDSPTRQAMLPRLVSERELMSAIGLNSAAYNGATLVGPLVGGLLIGPIGVGGIMLVNAISYLAVVAALLVMAPPPPRLGQRTMSALTSIREGLGYVRHEPVLRWVIVLGAAGALFARPYIQLLPAVAHDTLHVGAVELSWLLAASGAGALVGALATASLGGLRRRGIALVASLILAGTGLGIFALQRTLWPALLLLGLTSFGVMVFLGMATMLLQTRTPERLRGRVMSVYVTIFQGIMPLGTMVLGSLGTLVGIDVALLTGGVLAGLIGIAALVRVGSLREVGAARAVAEATTAF